MLFFYFALHGLELSWAGLYTSFASRWLFFEGGFSLVYCIPLAVCLSVMVRSWLQKERLILSFSVPVVRIAMSGYCPVELST